MRALLSLMVVTSALTFAQQKELPPEGGPPRPFHLAQTDDFTFANGMKVTLVPYGIVPLVAVRAFVSAGGVNEQPDQVWLSRLTGLLMKEGTKSLSSEQVAQQAADAGGQLEIEAGMEDTSVGGVVLSDHAAKFIALVADVLENASLPASEVPRLKADLIRELAIARAQPNPLARERFFHVMFPDSPYGRTLPTENELQGYGAHDVEKFFHNNFGAARTHLYVAGKLDAGLREAIRNAFEGWAKGPEPAEISANPMKARSLSLIDRQGAPQSTLFIGLPVADPTSPDYVTLDVMNALLGGSFASRITSNIREQKGYTYSPFSQIGTRRHLAWWVEVADVTTAVTGPSMVEIFKEIDRLRRETPSEEELKGIENYLAGLFVLRNTVSPDAVIGQLQFVDSQGLNRSFLSDYVQKVIAVRPPDIQRVAETYLTPQKMTIVVVGDKTKIADQVKPFESSTQ